MQFSDLVFLAFFLVVLLLHNLPLSWRLRKFNLLWLSYIFYAAWNPPFVVLLWASTLVDWFVGKRLYRAERLLDRRLLLGVSLAVNLGMLSYFKYGGFLLENFVAIVQAFGIDWQPARASIVLPIGISFYTFQTLSYTLDIYNKRAKPWTSFLDYALFVTFFPQLVAGPIVRARHFLPQCLKKPVVTAQQFGWGLCLFVIGCFEKIVVADGILAGHVEKVFDSGAAPTMLDSWVGCYGFAVQVFCDFSGYSLCAIGVAKCLGFHLPDNFRFPFAAVGFAAFWKRWHISLSNWIRDYVYSMIRGHKSQGRSGRWMFNIILSSALVGLWHGAAWHWVMWGTAVGVVIVVENMVIAATPDSDLWSTKPFQFVVAFFTFALFAMTMIFARCAGLEAMGDTASAMYFGSGDTPAVLTQTARIVVSSVALLFFLGHWCMRHSSLDSVAERMPWPLKSVLIASMIGLILMSRAPDRAFIYFQF